MKSKKHIHKLWNLWIGPFLLGSCLALGYGITKTSIFYRDLRNNHDIKDSSNPPPSAIREMNTPKSIGETIEKKIIENPKKSERTNSNIPQKNTEKFSKNGQNLKKKNPRSKKNVEYPFNPQGIDLENREFFQEHSIQKLFEALPRY